MINLEDYKGKFLPHSISDNFHTMDGFCVAAWLCKQGYDVKEFKDTGRNGLAVTVEGFTVSTNGYVSKEKD